MISQTELFPEYLHAFSQSSQYCYKNTFPDGYYQYGCGSTSVGETVVYSWPDMNPYQSIGILYTGGAFNDATVDIFTITLDTATTEEEEFPTTLSTPDLNILTSTVVIGVLQPTNTPESQANTPPIDHPGGLTIAATASYTAISSKTFSTISGSASDISANDTSAAAVAQPTGQNKGLSTGVMIAIGVAAGVVAMLCIALLAFCCIRRRKQSKESKDSQKFLNTPSDGAAQVTQYDQPIMGTRMNPTELYQGLPVKVKDPQHHAIPSPQYNRDSGHTNSIAHSHELDPSCEPVQATPQSAVSSATFQPGSPRPSTMSPTPTMHQYPYMYELPTNNSTRIPELDSSEAGRR